MAKGEIWKNCGQAADKKEKICKSCGSKIKRSIFKKWWFWVIVVVAVISIYASDNTINNTNNSNTTNSNTADSNTTDSNTTDKNISDKNNDNATVGNNTKGNKSKNSPYISKAEFEALKTGMTYEETVAIIGSEGELTSQVDIAGYDTKMYIWHGESAGANANATFQNNALVSKAQIGLK